jgi:hypothetical protein
MDIRKIFLGGLIASAALAMPVTAASASTMTPPPSHTYSSHDCTPGLGKHHKKPVVCTPPPCKPPVNDKKHKKPSVVCTPPSNCKQPGDQGNQNQGNQNQGNKGNKGNQNQGNKGNKGNQNQGNQGNQNQGNRGDQNQGGNCNSGSDNKPAANPGLDAFFGTYPYFQTLPAFGSFPF